MFYIYLYLLLFFSFISCSDISLSKSQENSENLVKIGEISISNLSLSEINHIKFHLVYSMINACRDGNLNELKKILYIGSNFNLINEKFAYESGEPHISAVEMAIGKGHIDIVDFLFSNGADKNQICEDGSSLVVKTVEWDYLDNKYDIKLNLVKILLCHEVDKDNYKKAFKIALENNYLEIIQAMIYYGVDLEGIDVADINLKNTEDIKSYSSILQLHLLNPQILIINKTVQDHITNLKLLLAAVQEGSKNSGNMKTVKELQKYISLGIVDENNNTLLDMAIQNIDKLMVVTLLCQNEDCKNEIYRKNWNNEYLICNAIKNNGGSIRMISFLLNLGQKLV